MSGSMRNWFPSQLVLFSAGLTISALPWFLGSAIPQAMFVLLAGTLLTAALTFAASFPPRRLLQRMPVTAWPLIGLMFIGVLQLLPVFSPAVLQMHRAVNPSLASELPAVVVQAGQNNSPRLNAAGEPRVPRTLLPDQTRGRVAQLSALVVLAVCVSAVVRSSRDMVALTWMLAANGCLAGAVALSQQLDGPGTELWAAWKISANPGYGSFVNPNNAAAWLLATLGPVLFLANYVWFRMPQAASRRAAEIDPHRRIRTGWELVVRRVGTASVADTGLLVVVILLIAAVIGSLSRSGGLALVAGLLGYSVCLRSWRRMLLFLLGMAGLAVPVGLMLSYLGYDAHLRQELATLSSPVSQLAIRIQHWRDTLVAVRDFGWLGTGLGSYRYASLPYQTRYTANWFQHADNQFVEVVVEAGIPGLICFLSLGIGAMVAAWRAAAGGSSRSAREGDAAVRAFARSIWFVVPALAVSAFFDYGTWLPAVSALVVVQIAGLESMLHSAGLAADDHALQTRRHGLAFAIGRAAILLTCLAVVLTSLPETMAASRLYAQLAQMERMVDRPDPKWLVESGKKVSETVAGKLAEHPDWFEARRVLLNFDELRYRQAILTMLTADNPLSDEQYARAFRTLDPFEVAHRLLTGRRGTEAHETFVSTVNVCLRNSSWLADARRLMCEHPLMPGVARKLLAMEIAPVAGESGRPQSATTSQLLFVHPSEAAAFAEIGSLLQHSGRVSAAVLFWKRSLTCSDRFLPDILRDAAAYYGVPAAVDRFAPQDFEACLSAAVVIGPRSPLGTALLARCDRIWSRFSGGSSKPSVPSRGRQLALMGRSLEAIRLIDEALASDPTSIQLRKARADALEWSGDLRGAYDEWLRIRLFSPSNPDYAAALKRLLAANQQPRRGQRLQDPAHRLPGL
jgi:O-antigen ligase/tetratricopeptide (TPR) repeat protein